MGRKGTGVEPREKSIRVSFVYQGKRQKETLLVSGKPMAPTPSNVKHATRLVAEIKEKIRNGVFTWTEYFPASGESSPITLDDQLKTWLSTQRIERSTRKGYNAGISFWTQAEIEGEPLGTFNLRVVRTSHLMAAIAARPDLSGKTINNYACIVRDALELAVIDKLITENPAQHLKTVPHQKPPPDPFTPEEREQIISYARDRFDDQVWNFVELWFWSGLRTSEIIALRWPQVLLPTGKIVVRETRVGGRDKDSTKTHYEREVRLNTRAMLAIQRQRKHTQLAGEHVFLNPRDGKQWGDQQNFLRNFWTRMLARLGIRYRRPYNMRHTYATAMLMAGMTPAFCAKQMGHSVQVFLNTYAKWIDGDQDEREMGRLESTIVNAPGAPLASGADLASRRK